MSSTAKSSAPPAAAPIPKISVSGSASHPPRPEFDALAPVKEPVIAAGCYADSLYHAVLPSWRWRARRTLVSLLEAEIPYLTSFQVRFALLSWLLWIL